MSVGIQFSRDRVVIAVDPHKGSWTATAVDASLQPRQTFNPSEQLRAVRAAVSQPRTSLAQAQALVRGVASAAGLLRPLGASSLTGSIGPHRTWSTARVDLSDVKEIRSALGGTVNDIVLTIVAGG